MELNVQMFFGFMIWSVFCLTMLAFGRFRENRWKRAAKTMECHAENLQARVDKLADQLELCERLLNESCNAVGVIADGYGAAGEKIDRHLFASGFRMYLSEEWPSDVEITEEDEPVWYRSVPEGVETYAKKQR